MPKRLANLTGHWQTGNLDLLSRLGYEVLPEPLIPHIQNMDDPEEVAAGAVREALAHRVDGVLVAGRTDLAMYATLLAIEAGLEVYTPRVRQGKGTWHVEYRNRLLGLLRIDPFVREWLARQAGASCGREQGATEKGTMRV